MWLLKEFNTICSQFKFLNFLFWLTEWLLSLCWSNFSTWSNLKVCRSDIVCNERRKWWIFCFWLLNFICVGIFRSRRSFNWCICHSKFNRIWFNFLLDNLYFLFWLTILICKRFLETNRVVCCNFVFVLT